MSKGPLILWLVIELERLYLTPAASESVVRAFWGQSVTLPCTYSSWSPKSNSMCWGKGQCPNSKCNDELLYTDGTRVVSRKLPKYQLLGNIRRGDVSLTIFNTNEGDSGVYCCRIEVPGWFNDVKRNIRLELRGPTTTRSTTPIATTATTAAVTTTTAVLPTTTVVPTPDLPGTPPLQMRTAAALTTTAATCPLTTQESLREEDTILLTLEPSTEGPILTADSETVLPRTSQRSTEATSADTALLTSKASETPFLVQNEFESEQIKMTNNYNLLMIVAPSLGFVLLALLLAYFLRGKVMKTNCVQKHTRLDSVGESKNVLDERENEDGLFTL
uniref:T cell immunoglobulin and mucin domain containing 4 n=1 Tax=Phocoena sinus TaxID=42100 RepID=A0A8C9C3M7_PHOSS